jgi:hypothetical protein
MMAKLIFLNGFTERDAYEAAARGYLSHVVVALESKLLYPITFYDPIRLKQDLDDMAANGVGFIAEPGIIILQEITIEMMESSVQVLSKQGYFDHFLPITMEEIHASHGAWPPSRGNRGAK